MQVFFPLFPTLKTHFEGECIKRTRIVTYRRIFFLHSCSVN